MERDKHILILNDYEQRMIVNCLKSCCDHSERVVFSQSELERLILKVIDAPVKKGRKPDHHGR